MNRPEKPLSIQLAIALRGSVVGLARRLRAKAPAQSITPARLSMLRWLHRQGAMTAGQLAAADSLQPQSVTRLLAALEQSGFITRDIDGEDRRRAVFNITPDGLKVVRSDALHRDKWLAELIDANLSPAECDLLKKACALLDRLSDESNPA